MLRALTPALIFIDVLFFSVICPIWMIFRDEEGVLPPERLRKRAVILIALISGLPLVAVICWDHVGLPSDPRSWTAFILFWLAHITIVVVVFVTRFVKRARLGKSLLAALGFVVLVIIQTIAPPSATLIELYSRKVPIRPFATAPAPCDDPNMQPIFAHISDLHITEQLNTRDGKQPGNNRMANLLERINERRPPFLIVSGDITDEGMSTQWTLVDQLFRPLHTGTEIFFSTGNHDLNYFFGRDPEEHPWTWFGLKPLRGLDAEPRIFRAAEFQARHLRAVHSTSGSTLQDLTANVPTESNLTHFPKQIDECTESCIADADVDPGQTKSLIGLCRSSCRTDVESIRFHYFHDLSESFPLYYLDEASHTAFISMTTSTADTAEVGRNAIGLSGSDQIRNLRAELKNLPNTVKNIVLVQHHPLLWNGVPSFPSFIWADFLHPRKSLDAFYTSPWFLAVFLHNNIAEGEQIYAMLNEELAKRPGTSAIVAFGHRHQRSLGQISAITFEEAPNLATENPKDFGFYLVGTKEEVLHVSWCPLSNN